MTEHRIGTREEWQAARDELLAEEKELTRRNDELARKRRELPWVPVEKDYSFETADGTKSLADLFDGRSQLLVYHFMFGPEYEAGCPVCSSIADNLDPQQTAVTFWVYPESFAAYRRLRDYLHERDVVVAGRPLPEGFPIASNRNGSASRGQ